MKFNKNLIYDVGLHKGEDTDYYLKKGFKVVSFEADPDLAKYCRERFKTQISSGQLTIVEGAIIDTASMPTNSGKIRFYKNEKSVWGTVVGEWSERNSKLGRNSQVIEVDIVDFGQCLQKYGIPYYLKIDIEGMDTICLKALRNFNDRPAYISIESEKNSFQGLEAEFNIFTELGYDRFQVVNQSKVPSVKEPSDSKEGQFVNYTFKEGSSGLFGKDLPSAEWQTLKGALETYKKIFRRFSNFGDSAPINKSAIGRLFTRTLNKLFAYPGWYDTHARHSSIKSSAE